MTTAAAPLLPPPTIPENVLDPLLDDHERACEIRYSGPCNKVAAWVMSGHCPACPRSETLLACDEHKQLLTATGVMCRPFMHDAEITRVEPLR